MSWEAVAAVYGALSCASVAGFGMDCNGPGYPADAWERHKRLWAWVPFFWIPMAIFTFVAEVGLLWPITAARIVFGLLKAAEADRRAYRFEVLEAHERLHEAHHREQRGQLSPAQAEGGELSDPLLPNNADRDVLW